jgi:Cu(I)/Ag(I) efflux system membrane protein CusA/SilA
MSKTLISIFSNKHLERAEPDRPRTEILIEAAKEVGPAPFIITVSFTPIFTLE